MTKANRDRLFKEVADRISEAVLPEPDASFPENSEQDNLDSVSARPRRKTPIGPADLPRNSAELPAGKIPGRRKHFVMAVLTGHPVE